MKNLGLVLSFIFLFMACGKESASSEATAPEEKMNENSPDTSLAEVKKTETPISPYRLTYRSDGFYPGISSEWFTITTDTANYRILSIEYWNTEDEEKTDLSILTQEFSEGELRGYEGTLAYPNQDPLEYVIVEDRFILIHEGDRMQEFFYDEWE